MLRKLRALGAGEGTESGMAMVMVLGIMLVGAIITTTLAFVIMFNSQRTVINRAEERALASADSAIDLVHSMVASSTYAELHNVCDLPDLTINGDTVAIDLEYVVTRGSSTYTLDCPLATDITSYLTVTADAVTDPQGLEEDPITRTVVARFTPTPPEVTLDKAIFSESTTTLRNGSMLIESSPDKADAHIYSNGGITCSTNEEIEGSVIAAHGDVNLDNTCKIYSNVWASGKVKLASSSAWIDGDVYSADTTAEWAVEIRNSGAYISGSVLANGGIYLTNSSVTNGGAIWGNAYSYQGGITLNNGSEIRGSALAYTNLNLENGSKVGVYGWVRNGTITGQNNGNTIGTSAIASGTISNKVTSPILKPNTTTSVPNPIYPAAVYPDSVGYPGKIQVPPREAMARVTMTSADIALWVAAGYQYEPYTNASDCTGSRPATIINGAAPSGTTGPRLISFEGCTGAVQFNNADLVLKSDVVLVSNQGFNSSNLMTVRSSVADEERMLYLIVPADSPNVTWSTTSTSQGQLVPTCVSGKSNISVDKLKFFDIASFFYTPCTFDSKNGTDSGSDDLKGQIYAGFVDMKVGLNLQMDPMPVPSLKTKDPEPTDETDMRVAARFDVHN
ncbi:hypothetical protein [Demequina silvatica]|uniref:hypothetical protein n=1 Tax=Demequina silvatica TaxID=1638988 RepID=UPI0007852BF9|nr:hypothetical protein [Demequina silvatica]